MPSTSIIETDFMNIPRLCIIRGFKITTKTISLKLIQLIFLTHLPNSIHFFIRISNKIQSMYCKVRIVSFIRSLEIFQISIQNRNSILSGYLSLNKWYTARTTDGGSCFHCTDKNQLPLPSDRPNVRFGGTVRPNFYCVVRPK